MGQRTDIAIAAFQDRVGLKPVHGQESESLDRLQTLAFELIKIVELEKSGIRDGDGHWYGSDPVTGILQEIAECGARRG